MFGSILSVRVFLRIPWLSGLILRGGCIGHIANGGSLMAADDTEDNGCDSAPAAFMWRDTVWSRAIVSPMANVTAAEALIAP